MNPIGLSEVLVIRVMEVVFRSKQLPDIVRRLSKDGVTHKKYLIKRMR